MVRCDIGPSAFLENHVFDRILAEERQRFNQPYAYTEKLRHILGETLQNVTFQQRIQTRGEFESAVEMLMNIDVEELEAARASLDAFETIATDQDEKVALLNPTVVAPAQHAK